METLRKFAVLTAILVISGPAAAGIIIDQSFTSTSNQGAQIGRTYDGLAQTFTVGITGIFDSAELLLSQTSVAPTTGLTISLVDTSAGAPNTIISSVLIASSNVSGTSGNYLPVIADFSSANHAVNVGDVLAITISSASEYAWNAGIDALATYAGGQRYSDAAGGGVNWSLLATWDFSLKTYVTTSVPEPSIITLFGLGLFGLGFARRKKA